MMAARKRLFEDYGGHGGLSGGDLIDRITVLSGTGTQSAQVIAAAPPAGAERETPPDKPLNAVALSGAGAETEYPLEHRKDGMFDVFTVGDLSYRLGGVKPLFVTSLRVNVRIGDGGKSYYDGLDLYLARSRTAFALASERVLGTEAARVERDLVRILEHLEKGRDAQLVNDAGTENEIKMSEAEREAGLELLRDKHLFKRIIGDLSALGYVGEELNKQLLYVCASSRKLDNPLSVLILSQSASGKSYLVELVKRLMPPEDVVAVTSLSDQALNYIGDLSHKFLILGEAVHSEAVEYQLREMLSGKELSRLVVEKDPESGRMESRMMKIPVIVSSVMGSTAGHVNPENASRCFVINADESREQTQRIHEYQRHKRTMEYFREGKAAAAKIISAHRAAQRLLRNVSVINDFARYLDFPSNLMRSRRDHERFLDLIDAICFLRQYQKEAEKDGANEFIRCDMEDYAIAYRIMVQGVLTSTMEELGKGTRLLYGKIRDWARAEAKKKKLPVTELRFTQRQVREATGLGHTWVKANMRELVEYEYLLAEGRERSRTYYRLQADGGILSFDLSMIPAPEVMAGRMAPPPHGTK